MNFKEMKFAGYMIVLLLLLTGLWFFAAWAVGHATEFAYVANALLLPVYALPVRFLPPEKLCLCSSRDLKFINDLGRGAFFATVAFAIMILAGGGKYLSHEFVTRYLFGALIGQFVLHVFAVLVFVSLAILAPREARKKPLKTALMIYLASTFMQMMVFAETTALIKSLS